MEVNRNETTNTLGICASFSFEPLTNDGHGEKSAEFVDRRSDAQPSLDFVQQASLGMITGFDEGEGLFGEKQRALGNRSSSVETVISFLHRASILVIAVKSLQIEESLLLDEILGKHRLEIVIAFVMFGSQTHENRAKLSEVFAEDLSQVTRERRFLIEMKESVQDEGVLIQSVVRADQTIETLEEVLVVGVTEQSTGGDRAGVERGTGVDALA